MIFLRNLLFILLFVPLLPRPVWAETLYQRSLARFQEKAAKARPNDFTFVVLGDSRDGDAIFRKALKLAKWFDPLFILHGGDYSSRGGETETARFLSMVKETVPEIPVFVVMGNHENHAVFWKEIGPSDFTLHSDRLGLTVVAVDNSDNQLRAKELDYLRNRLSSSARFRFAAMHVPPKSNNWNWHSFTEGADELKAILAKDKLQAIFFSHVHLFDRSEFGGVPAFITGGAGAPLVTAGFPGDPIHHFLLVHVKDGHVAFTKVPVPD